MSGFQSWLMVYKYQQTIDNFLTIVFRMGLQSYFRIVTIGWNSQHYNNIRRRQCSLLKILSFSTSHYATGMQLIVVYNYLYHVYNYKYGCVCN